MTPRHQSSSALALTPLFCCTDFAHLGTSSPADHSYHPHSDNRLVTAHLARHDKSGTASLQTTARHVIHSPSHATMSSQPPAAASKAAISSSKVSATTDRSSPASSITQQFFSNDSGQRRSGSSGANARATPAPRNQQTSKPKHKQGKKFRALDEDHEAELFAMQNTHGRKGQTSITHLMNFSLPPRPHQQQQSYHRHSYNGPRRNGRVNPTWGLGSGYHSVDKAR